MQLSTRNLKLPKGSLSRPAFRFAGTTKLAKTKSVAAKAGQLALPLPGHIAKGSAQEQLAHLAAGLAGEYRKQGANAALAQENSRLRTHNALLERELCSLREDARYYKAQTTALWWDFADTRKRLLDYMAKVDSLNSELRAERNARIEAESRLAWAAEGQQ